ncbi:BTAD domain-containing putative transcriptional regulator [Streptomyces sp. NL15-2K]|uniref:AfsR/SARP family transcriptional regulator n=1 Tax=Streptomyces sp. NL15-2K TaxID=376149 RepID=UPI000F56122B|nr:MULTISPECIES: BTAD domain-containing putative transcriptional regulator [Actinomycetes]WKX10482.1 BTAD domain-containing putative transcriptional regulator [Kutzneria buriramensis]GCB47988.1 signal transduction response regulator [Streptomyces sp. NL15-2K]
MRYTILGVTQAKDDHGTAVPLGGPRLRALLTALALRPGRVTAPETLIDEVWADAPPQDAPAALQALVGRLRRTVGKDTVTSEPGGYRLAAAPDDVDLFRFERLVRQGTTALANGDAPTAARHLRDALALWRGPALADLPDRTAATRPEALRLEATRARIEADLRLGRAQDVVPELKELTAAHPYDEPLHVLLIRALRDTARRADALAAYETARRTLADGLGTDPGPELRALHTDLLTPPTREPRIPPTREPRIPPTREPRIPPTRGRQAPPTREPQIPPTREPQTPPLNRTTNIRPRLTTFVGREPELDAIRSELHRARLVTLTGPGGSGKTRLAEEAAAGLPQAWLVELAPLDRPEAVPGAVVSALGLRETVLMTSELTAPQDDPVALLIEYCASRSQLLILDNCEHVIDAAAALAETLLTHCPGLTILATSRESLGVPGESVRPVEPLLPDQAQRLFAERAAAVSPDADALLGDKEAVAEICRRLDGLPLAIELAAARLRLLTPRQIADRLDDRFRLLTSGSRTVLPRQQTLRAVVDWSWELLDDQERTILCEVSVFAGGWELEAAEAVCTGPAADLLGALVDKSLIVATPYERPGGDGMRYRMLETIHEYATERAAESPDLRAAAERRHRAWARALAEEAEPLLRSAGQLPWIARLETELDNIRAALFRVGTAGAEEEAGSLALAMGWFWWLRNYRHEGAEWIDQVLRLGAAIDATAGDSTGGSPDPVDAFLAAPHEEAHHPLHTLRMRLRILHLYLKSEVEPLDGRMDDRLRRYIELVREHFERGGPDAARMPGIVWPLTSYVLSGAEGIRASLDVAVDNCRTHGDDWAVAVALMFRTHMAVDSPGGLEGVDDDLAELRTLSRRAGDRWIRAQVCSAAGETAMARSRFEEAKGEYEEALRLAYEVGAYTETPFLIARLAEIDYRAGDRQAALAALDEASAAADRHGVADSRAFVLLMRAQIALDEKDTARARVLCGAARAETERGTPPPQFMVMLNAVEAWATVAESGPEHGLPQLVDSVREAVEWRCAEAITAALVDGSAALLSDLGDHARVARLLAAAQHWRGGHPRPMPERANAERAEAAARAGLSAGRYEEEYTRGASLTPADVLRELGEALRAHRPADAVSPGDSGSQ